MEQTAKSKNALMIGALGVVFGEIGTSPLYAVKQAFGFSGLAPNGYHIVSVLSLIIWALILLVSLKYLVFVLKASNKGEGGVLALTALISSMQPLDRARRSPLILIGVFGAALLFGDGVITPAITVLSAIEGLEVATPLFEPFIIPIVIAILVALFCFQYHGTAKLGAVFGPILSVWFFFLAILGIGGILKAPEVLEAFNPIYALDFCLTGGNKVFYALGAVFLTVTGAEAIYADMGHFGASAIRRAWYYMAFPSLLLNYLGQGALLMSDPTAVVNPFYHLVPNWGLYPMVMLATMAAVIASQALITGVYSIVQQAIHLGYLPRLKVVHTSHTTIGQVYIPLVNWLLLTFTIWVVVTFQSSSHLAAAYGLAVSLIMLITTVLACTVALKLWNWPVGWVGVGFVLMVLVDGVFLGANMLKIHHGGWFPLALGGGVFVIMTTWKKGRMILSDLIKSRSTAFDKFISQIKMNPPVRVPGTAVFMTADAVGIPASILHNIRHNKNLHERNVFLSIFFEERPFIKRSKRLEIIPLGENFFRIIARYGFMEQPDINYILSIMEKNKLDVNLEETVFFVGKETIIAVDNNKGMAIWREKLFAIMLRNSEAAIIFFNIPRRQVIELGMQLEI